MQQELARYIEKIALRNGTHQTDISALAFIRSDRPLPLTHSIYEPSLCIIAQGAKKVILGSESYVYEPASYLVASVKLPINGQIIQATHDRPYLSLRLQFSQDQILDVVGQTDANADGRKASGRGLQVNRIGETLLEAVLRLVRLLDKKQDIPMLAPLIIREILYRILQDEQGGESFRQFAMTGSHAGRIAEVVRRIGRDFAKPLRIEQLAKASGMSSSALHFHFKEVTAMSPLQYQKRIRLQEARRLLMQEAADAASAGFQVGYESPSQFSREYSRMFGLPPATDMKRLRATLPIET